MSAAPDTCPHGCGRTRSHDAGDYYHEKRCRADQIIRQIEAETDSVKKLRLQHELGPELARSRYVGD